MNTQIVSTDKVTLPNALLGGFKRRFRIDHDDDDELVVELLQEGIELFERTKEITVFPSEFIIEPESCDWQNGKLTLPVTPINSIAIADTAETLGQIPHSDQSLLGDMAGYLGGVVVGDFILRARGIHGVRIYHLTGSAVSGMTISITSGYSKATLPPEIRGVVQQITGHLYEYREIYVPNATEEPSMWLNQIMAGFWLPRV